MQLALFSTFGSSSTKYRRLRCDAKKKAAKLLPPSYGRAATFLNFPPTILSFSSSSPTSFFLCPASHTRHLLGIRSVPRGPEL